MQVLRANQQVDRVVASVLLLFCGARLAFFHGWSEAAREKTRTCAHDESSQFRSLTMWASASARVRVRVAPRGGMGPSLRTVWVSCIHWRTDVQ